MIVCQGCGGPLPPSAPTGRPRRWCADACRARTRRRRHATADHRGPGWDLYVGDARAVLPTLAAGSVHTVVTSPPYWTARDYGGHPGQLGHEGTVTDYVDALAEVGDRSRSGRRDRAPVLAPRRSSTDVAPRASLLGLPWRVANALTDRGWVLRNAIVWHRPNDLPHPTRTRLDNRTEMVFLLTRSPRYWFDRGATGTGDVWTVPVIRSPAGHPAAFPVELARRCVAAGCPPGGTVLDPFGGSMTTGVAALAAGRRFVGVELHPGYAAAGAARLGVSRSPAAPQSAHKPRAEWSGV